MTRHRGARPGRLALGWLLALPAAVIVALVLTTSALATGPVIYCVSDPSCPAGGIAEPDLQTALTTADALGSGNSATVDLGPGTFTAPTGFHDSSGNSGANPISIVGSGEASTTLSATTAGATVLNFGGSPADEHASVSDLTVDAPSGGIGVAYPESITNVAIVGSGTGANPRGLETQDATITNVIITMPLGIGSSGLFIPNELPIVDGLTITADIGIGPISGGNSQEFTDVRIFADETGIVIAANDATNPDATLTESEIVMTGSGTALELDNAQGIAGALDASFDTIVGNNTVGSTGVAVTASTDSGSVATLNLSDSIVEGFSTALSCTNTSPGSATLNVKYSDFNPTGDVGTCSGGLNATPGNVNTNPDLVTLSDGDEPLAWNSPLIDAGDPTITGPLTDLLGNPRPLNGGTGHDVVDMGAFEYQYVAPTAVAGASPASVEVGVPATFSAAGSSDLNPGDTLSYSWAFDDGATATGATATHAFATAGAHHATLTVTAPDGLHSTAQAAVTVTAAPVPTPPTITALTLDPTVFRSSSPGHGKGKKHPLGATFSYTLSEAGIVTIRIQHAVQGRKSHGNCVAPGKHAKGAKCTRWLTVGTLPVVFGTEGNNTTVFKGKVNGKALKPGHYRAEITANGVGGNTLEPPSVAFTIARR